MDLGVLPADDEPGEQEDEGDRDQRGQGIGGHQGIEGRMIGAQELGAEPAGTGLWP